MTQEIKIGPLTFVGEPAGAHVHVSVLGDGPPGHRPLCGRVVVTDREWKAFAGEAPVLDIARTVGARWREQEGVNGSLLDLLAEVTR